MKIAIVHDQIQEFGGAERVLVALKQIFPQADVFTSFYNPSALGQHNHHFDGWNIITSWADRVPGFKKLYSPLRFLAPHIWESFDFGAYDLVLSSSGWYMCKGIITRPETQHICYLHHQPRYLYFYETAVEWQKYWPIKVYAHLVNHGLRMWDFLSSQRPDHFIANSLETKKRIGKYYRRDDVTVIYPPVTLAEAPAEYAPTGSYYVTTSRLAKAKHIDILIEAANKLKLTLKVIGKGKDEAYLRSLAGETVEFLTNVSDDQFKQIYSHAKAFLFASVDDEFGIAPVEAMSHGLPVIAFASGGLKETVSNGKNGFLYQQLSADSLIEKINVLEQLPENNYLSMRAHARASSEQYSFENFRKNILQLVKERQSHHA